ncbi:MAG: hypothetical protein ACPG40_04595 [Alphaproteobacteria bacterium]
MNHATKIATCTYCGTKTAIVLASGARHELTCSACAAPLDQMELLQTSISEPGSAASDAVSPAPIAPTTPPRTRPKADETCKTKSAGFGLPWPDWKSKVDDDDDDDDDKDDKRRKPKKSKKRKKRKSLAKKLFEEAADKIEDIFD